MANPYRAARRFERFLPSGFSLDSLDRPPSREDYFDGESGKVIATIVYRLGKKEIAVERESV